MKIILLSSRNVISYLAEQNLIESKEEFTGKIEQKAAKNFNLLVSLSDKHKLLVKQERLDSEGNTAGEFLREWYIREFLQRFSELSCIHLIVSEILHFNFQHSIIVFNYLDVYRDLAEVYVKENIYSSAISASVGIALATIHRTTLNHQDYQDFLSQGVEDKSIERILNSSSILDRIGPDVFGSVPADGIKFFALYQRYDSLGKAISELASAFDPCCLTHNDLKLNNILLHNDWKQMQSQPDQLSESVIRLIDWERGGWGDPAFDLGMLIASYLQLWLSSLVVSKSIDIQESLRLAMTPLEQLQPSIAALAKAYFDHFPKMLDHRPDFLKRVVQFAGLALIQQIQATIQYQKSFGNTGICMLQVAKSLLCRPEQSVPAVFGTSASELTSLNSVHV